MNANFNKALQLVLVHEGGYVNHPNDKGGPTNRGITLANFRKFVKPDGTIPDLKRITVEQAGVVYKQQYWDKVAGDDLPRGLDYAVFDFAVNSGVSRAAKFLQRIVGTEEDGKIGQETLTEVFTMLPSILVELLCDVRMRWLRNIKGKSGWMTFGKGWERRVTGVKREALKMVIN